MVRNIIIIVLLLIILALLKHQSYEGKSASEWADAFSEQSKNYNEMQSGINFLLPAYENLQVCGRRSLDMEEIRTCLMKSPMFYDIQSKRT